MQFVGLQSMATLAEHRGTAARRGLTAIELLIVVTIIGILAAAAVPTFFDSLAFHRVESAARRVKTDLEYLRQTARLTSRTQAMTFTGLVYTADAGSDVRDFDRPGEQYSVDLAAAPYEIDRASVNLEGDGSTISFDGYGVPQNAGTIVLEVGNYQCTVTIGDVDGEASITSNHPGARAAKR
jgi:prepilin-type N-terminal cleavage/methylation domain-containing protein